MGNRQAWPGQCNFELETAVGDLRSSVRNSTELISSAVKPPETRCMSLTKAILISRHTNCVKAWQFTFPTSERSRLSPTSKNFGKYFSSFKNIILNQGPLNQAMGDWGQEKHYIKHYQITQRTQIIGSVHSCNLHWFKIWSSGGTTCIASKVGHQVASLALPNCLGLPCWHYPLVLSWYHHQPESHQLSLNKVSRSVSFRHSDP